MFKSSLEVKINDLGMKRVRRRELESPLWAPLDKKV